MPVIDINMSEFVELIKKYYPNPKCIVEVGSLDAKDSLFFKENFPEAECFAIEGLTENYEMYMSKLKNIKCINEVVSNKNKIVKFYKKEINGLHSIYNRGDRYGTEILEISCFTMDYICDKYSIPEIDVMKIDVEGATYEVLSGMKKLKDVKIMHIETESEKKLFGGQVLHPIVTGYLETAGFTMVRMSTVEITGGGKQHDSVWVNNGLAYK